MISEKAFAAKSDAGWPITCPKPGRQCAPPPPGPSVLASLPRRLARATTSFGVGCRAQGWWWEAPDEGVVSDGGASDERFTWALAAASALRNLALTPANRAHCGSAACVFALARRPMSLSDRGRSPR